VISPITMMAQRRASSAGESGVERARERAHVTRYAAHSSSGERLLGELVYATDVVGRLGLAATSNVDGYAAETASALESLGYEFAPSIDDRNDIAHRFRRGESTVDLVMSGPDVVDVLVADHAAPRVAEKLRGRTMVAIEGGTQALRRTIHARLEIIPGRTTTMSVPSVFGALILKAAAYQTDSRDRERHLQDAALLLAVIADPYAEREQFAGSDKSRLLTLVRSLPDDAREWNFLPADSRTDGQAALRILTA